MNETLIYNCVWQNLALSFPVSFVSVCYEILDEEKKKKLMQSDFQQAADWKDYSLFTDT